MILSFPDIIVWVHGLVSLEQKYLKVKFYIIELFCDLYQ